MMFILCSREQALRHWELEGTGKPFWKKLLPPLLRSYLQAGSKVHGAPALDKDFQCIDLLTILDLRSVQGSYARRYFSK